MFQNLRASSQLYILHKDKNPYIEYGSVVSVSAPKPKYPTTPQLGQFPPMEMVVDITVNIGGQATNLQGLPAGAEIADFGQQGNIVVSCSRDAMNNELVTMRQKSNDVLGSVEYHRNVIEACDKKAAGRGNQEHEGANQLHGQEHAPTDGAARSS